MNTKSILACASLLAIATVVNAQTKDISLIIKSAQSRSGAVKAAQATVDARKASLQGAKSGPSAFLELGPGVGFTNGNSILSQEFDLFGRRKSASLLASAQLKIAELGVAETKNEVAITVLSAVAQYLSASEELVGARASLEAANSLLAAVQKQHEVGEAPKVHVTRAELDVLRASQLVTSAEGKLAQAQASLSSVVGELPSTDSVSWPSAPSLATGARSFALLMAEQSVLVAEAQTEVASSDFAPTFSAAIASDAWSLDRDVFQRDSFGLQFLYRMPLGRNGQKRSAILASKSELDAAKSNVTEAKRLAELKFAESKAAFNTAQKLAASYDGDLLPKGELMLKAMREGYAAGLVTLVEVLESQQTLVKLRQERTQAVLNFRLAELELWRAQLTLPGTEVPR